MLDGSKQNSDAPSGLAATPLLGWGTHIGHFFEAADELHEVLVPYFKAGLENNERCLWVTGAPVDAASARAALRSAVADLDDRERSGQIEIVDGDAFYDASKPLPTDALVTGLVKRAEDALAAGFTGLRTNGNCTWVGQQQWTDFQHYESLIQQTVRGRRMICMCSYRPETLQAAEMIDVIDHHDLVLRRRNDRTATAASTGRATAARTTLLRSPDGDVSAEHEKRVALERRQHTFDLAMVASQMGTWRYTLADNICIYDENAQRLYGLTEARFVHDEHQVKDKFHPDDLELMWSRVRRALEPGSDGRYDIEYRVKQLDGSWRWLSAWGSVEFEGHGPNRTPVAISGASRDLSEMKKAEELQRLLVTELNHRVKNTLATVQAIIGYTLHRATDIQFARGQLNERIAALARVHDLLTLRHWTGANLRDVVDRALEPFAAAQLDIAGPSVEVSSHHTLALSLGLHELATNAAKYGALSAPEGRVEVRWQPTPGQLKLNWRESGGPRVAPPTRRGFGSRLLEDALARDLGGGTLLEYTPEGVRCEFTVVCA
jgi:PAS domain S-box-containing protein